MGPHPCDLITSHRPRLRHVTLGVRLQHVSVGGTDTQSAAAEVHLAANTRRISVMSHHIQAAKSESAFLSLPQSKATHVRKPTDSCGAIAVGKANPSVKPESKKANPVNVDVFTR